MGSALSTAREYWVFYSTITAAFDCREEEVSGPPEPEPGSAASTDDMTAVMRPKRTLTEEAKKRNWSS